MYRNKQGIDGRPVTDECVISLPREGLEMNKLS